MSTGILSRRDFLKLSGASLLGILASELHIESAQATTFPFQGRVQASTLNVRDAPAFNGKKTRTLKRDNMI